jgi:N-acetylmuramoyl-L-alanine amidase
LIRTGIGCDAGPAPRPSTRRARAGLVALALLAAVALMSTGAAKPPAKKPAAVPAKPKPAAQLVRIRYWTAPDHTRLVLDLTGPSSEPVFRLTAPDAFEVFLKGARKSEAVTTEFVGDSLVAEVLPVVADSGVTVRIGLKKAVTPLGFVLAAADGVPDRIVVDVPAPPNPQADQQLSQRVEDLKRSKRFIVAIDAGHGGDDPGAIGYRRLQEADITLAVAKKLKAEVDQVPGMSAFLTRTGDYFIPLRKRIDLARKVRADVFVSIHCNASRNRDATGTEVFFLSLTGATDEASRSLAEAENAADMVGGVSAQTGDDVLSILFDLRQNDTIRKSSEVAEYLVDALGEESRLETRGVKQAGFVVLKAPEIPSVLVETAFITNPREAAMLKDAQFQRKVAEKLADGLRKYADSFARAPSN